MFKTNSGDGNREREVDVGERLLKVELRKAFREFWRIQMLGEELNTKV